MIIGPVESAFSAPVDGVREARSAFAPAGTNGLSSLEAPEQPGLGAFGAALGNAVEEANRADYAANRKVEALASGAMDDIHGTMISAKEADISLKLVGSVRTKILDAFQELWRTSV